MQSTQKKRLYLKKKLVYKHTTPQFTIYTHTLIGLEIITNKKQIANFETEQKKKPTKKICLKVKMKAVIVSGNLLYIQN